MHKLWITKLPDAHWPLMEVRLALRCFNPEATAKDAQDIIDAVNENGFALLGESEDITVIASARDFFQEHGGVATMREPIPERIEGKRMTAEGATPEQVFEKVAPGVRHQEAEELASAIRLTDKSAGVATFLLAHADGSPLNACQMALGLQRLTGDDTYAQAVAYMVLVFQPWLARMLHQQGLVEIKENA